MENLVYILGAGASVPEGAPVVMDFFPKAWELCEQDRLEPEDRERAERCWQFLRLVYRKSVAAEADFARLPTLDEVLSLIDLSLHQEQGVHAEYGPQQLFEIRTDFYHLISATLGQVLSGKGQLHYAFIDRVLQELRLGDRVTFISLNYDLLLDKAIADHGYRIDYGFGRAGGPWHQERALAVLKPHGSLNWGICPVCDHIEYRLDRVQALLPEGLNCGYCRRPVRQGVVITPTLLKAYNSAELKMIWPLAGRAVQQSTKLVFIGYSLPAADVPFLQLLQRALNARLPQQAPPAVHFITAAATEERRAAFRQRVERVLDGPVHFCFEGFTGQIDAT